MNYQKIYESLITKRQKNPAKGYTEKHHILPKSLGGSDNPTNLVVLSGREHWVAHLLLYKIHRSKETLYACNMMAMKCEERDIGYIKSSRLYEKVRENYSKIRSIANRKRVGMKYNVSHKNIHIYECQHCKESFERRSRKRRSHKYCSRRCSVLGNHVSKFKPLSSNG